MKTLLKPKALKKGDRLAAVSLSWGGAGLFRQRYEQGKRQFEQAFGVQLVEMPHTLDTPEEIYAHPENRLSDWMMALKDPEIKGILTCIGGDDTIRLLRHMTPDHFDTIRQNPKVFLGMSDTTANHLMCFKAGVSSFYSASLLFGYAENGGILDYMIQNTRQTLFESKPIGVLPENRDGFITEHVDWAQNRLRKRHPALPWRFIGGTQLARGRLIGGCFDMFADIMSGTLIYPDLEAFEGSILFLETSEDMVPPAIFGYWMRNLGARGILERINGLLLARPGTDFAPHEQEKEQAWIDHFPDFDDMILKILKEYGRLDLPVVTHMDFGHTVPQLVLPYGAMAEIAPSQRQVCILESGVA